MRTILRVVFVLAVTLPSAWSVDPAPLPKEIKAAKTLFVLNQGLEPGTMDVVYNEINKWPRWTLTDEREKADLIIVLSAQSYVYGMAAIGSGTAYGTTTVAVPLVQDNRHLTVVEPKSGLALLTLSCRRREINGNSRTGKTLVNLFKSRFPKDQR